MNVTHTRLTYDKSRPEYTVVLVLRCADVERTETSDFADAMAAYADYLGRADELSSERVVYSAMWFKHVYWRSNVSGKVLVNSETVRRSDAR